MDKLIKKIQNEKWRYAKTYSDTAPHEYILLCWNEELFNEITKIIDNEGINEKFYKSTVRYGYIGNYRYWYYNTYEWNSVLNRAPNTPTHLGNNYTPEEKTRYLIELDVVGKA